MSVIKLYAVLRADGSLKKRVRRRGGTVQVYENKLSAQRQAADEGDSVVEMDIDLDRAPLFIRGQAL